jgi:hypothetical protein
MKDYSESQVILCCGGKKCPIVRKISENEISIVDDYNGEVRMTIEQAKLIAPALNQLFKESLS